MAIVRGELGWLLAATALAVLARAAAEDPPYLDAVLDEEIKLADMEVKHNLKAIFDRRRAERTGETVRGLAARMAEVEMLLYAKLRGSLLAAKHAGIGHVPQWNSGSRYIGGWLVEDEDLVNIVLRRCIARGFASGLATARRRMKELSVLVKRHRAAAGVAELLRDFIQAYLGRKAAAGDSERSLEMRLDWYVRDLQSVHGWRPSPGSGRDPKQLAVETIDELIDEAAAARSAQQSPFTNPRDVLRSVDPRPSWLERVGAIERARHDERDPLDAAEVDSADPEGFLEFEEELFGRPLYPRRLRGRQ